MRASSPRLDQNADLAQLHLFVPRPAAQTEFNSRQHYIVNIVLLFFKLHTHLASIYKGIFYAKYYFHFFWSGGGEVVCGGVRENVGRGKLH